jgi:hypothetical protein
MKIKELLEMSQDQIIYIENDVKTSFSTIGIIINFSKHFGDRIVDNAVDEKGFKRDNVSPEELFEVFKNLKKHYRSIFEEAGQFNDEVKRGEFEGVIIDTFRKINVPFTLEFDKKKGKYILTCKTILKRENFHVKPKDHVIALRGK